jgi:hypothetical protein
VCRFVYCSLLANFYWEVSVAITREPDHPSDRWFVQQVEEVHGFA